MEGKVLEQPKQSLKTKAKLEGLHDVISGLTRKLFQPKQGSTGIRQTSRSMEQNKEFRNTPTRIVSTDFLPRYQVNSMGNFSTSGADPQDIHAEKMNI